MTSFYNRNRAFDREGVDPDNQLDFDARYSVGAMRGVAFYLLGYATEWTELDAELVCEFRSDSDDSDEHEHEDMCYLYDESEEIENKQTVRAVMVGDDTVHLVDVDDLTVIDDYCSGCGQIGCEGDFRHV